MLENKLHLIDLGDDETGPTHSLVQGHVSDEDFNEAYLANWSDDPLHPDDIKREYWVEGSEGWRKTDVNDPDGEPVTVTYW